jgi:hypothetical protein
LKEAAMSTLDGATPLVLWRRWFGDMVGSIDKRLETVVALINDAFDAL